MQLQEKPNGGDIIPRAAATNIAMAAGNEKLLSKMVVLGGGDEGEDIVKEWVGIGWIETDTATDEHKARLPILGDA